MTYECKYEYHKIDGEIETCHTCGSMAPTHKFGGVHREGLPGITGEDQYLCEFCASTRIGDAVNYPSQYPDHVLFQALAEVANLLLDKLTDRRKGVPE